MKKENNKEVPVNNPEVCDYMFAAHGDKLNKSIDLLEEDDKKGVKVYCKEPYAQWLYDLYNEHQSTGNISGVKDLEIGELYYVRPSIVNFDEKLITCEDVNSGTSIYVSFQDYPGDIIELSKGDVKEFKLILTKKVRGVYYGSHKRYMEIFFKDEMKDIYENEIPFEVKLVELVRGGYIGLYKNCIKCFIPGSHAAANVILNFEDYIGKIIPVVIDNFDSVSNMYIASYKKYINKTINEKINDLVIGKKYTGHLTSKPTNYGLFVEIDNYYTGLIHESEFDNYNKIKKKYRIGDAIDFYVKDVQYVNDKYRIILTLNEKAISNEKLEWQERKEKYMGKYMDYYYDNTCNKLFLLDKENGNQIGLNVDFNKIKDNLYSCTRALIKNVDVINENIAFELCS